MKSTLMPLIPHFAYCARASSIWRSSRDHCTHSHRPTLRFAPWATSAGMSMPGFVFVTSASAGALPPTPEFRHQPSSIIMYSKPDLPAKSMYFLIVGMSVPPLSGGGRYGPDHQSQAVLPGLIHEVSNDGSGFRLPMRLESISAPSRSPSMITRQGEFAPAAPTAARAISDLSSRRRDTRVCTPGKPLPCPLRYNPP